MENFTEQLNKELPGADDIRIIRHAAMLEDKYDLIIVGEIDAKGESPMKLLAKKFHSIVTSSLLYKSLEEELHDTVARLNKTQAALDKRNTEMAVLEKFMARNK